MPKEQFDPVSAASDRVDTMESTLRSALSRRLDNPIAETGVRGELTRHGLTSRLGQHRSDLLHQMVDPIIVAAPWLLGTGVAYAIVRRLVTKAAG